MRFLTVLAAFSAVVFSAYSVAAEQASLSVKLSGVSATGRIQPRFTFCQPAGGTSKAGDNVSPAISWTPGPDGTKSYAIIMHDPDVPSVFDDANQAGKTIAEGLERKEFIHWVLTDISSALTRLPEAADSYRVDAEGKRTQVTKYGVRGINSYGSFMKGEFYGYDGPCPPWNDERLHRYVFTVYALDVPSLGLKGPFTADDARAAMQGKILAKGTAEGTFTQYAPLLETKASGK